MKKLKSLFGNYYFNFALIVIFTGVVMYVSLYKNLEAVMAVVANASIFWMVIVVLLAYFLQVIDGLVLKTLANISHPNYSLANGFVNTMVAALFNGVTPSSTTGQVAQIYVFDKQGVKASSSVSILLMDFILYQVVLVGISLLFLTFKFSYFLSLYNSSLWLVIMGFLVDSFFVVMLFLLSSSPKVYSWVSHKGLNLLDKLHLIKNKEATLQRLDDELTQFHYAWNNLKSHRQAMIKVIIFNVFRLLLYYSVPVLVMIALKVPLTLDKAFNLMVLTTFVGMMNHLVPSPGGAGTVEASFILLVSPLCGYINTVSCSLLWRFATYHLKIVTGAILFAILGKIYKKKPDEIQNPENPK